MRKKRVLIIAQTPPPFHGQSIMQKHLVDAQWAWADKFFVRLDVSSDISSVGRFQLSKIFRILSVSIKILKLGFRGKFDILYYPPASPHRVPFYRDVLLVPLARLISKKIIFHFHAGGFNTLYDKLNVIEKKIARKIYNKPDAAIVLLEYLKKDIEWINAKTIFVVPNGIEPFTYDKQIVKDNFDVLFVGNIQKEKGPEELLYAIRRLKTEGRQIKTKFLGGFRSEIYREKLHALCNELAISDLVEFCGSITGEKKWTYYNGAKVFCLPTFYETEAMPVTFLEAMINGLPIVTTDWRANSEIVKKQINGILVEKNNSEQLANAINYLLSNEDVYKQMQKNNMDEVKNFSLKSHLERMEWCFKKMAGIV